MTNTSGAQTAPKHRRMLGQVQLTVHGATKKPELTRALMNTIASSVKLTGELLIGYPMHTDAVLVSAQGQVTVIDLSEGCPHGQDNERQDRAFVAVERLLRMDPALMEGRRPRITVQTITVRRGIGPVNPGDTEHPVVNITTARQHLEAFQDNPPQDVEPARVITQLLWMPPVT